MAALAGLGLNFSITPMAAANAAHQRQACARALKLGLTVHALKEAKKSLGT